MVGVELSSSAYVWDDIPGLYKNDLNPQNGDAKTKQTIEYLGMILLKQICGMNSVCFSLSIIFSAKLSR
jgi:hypothetical protein